MELNLLRQLLSGIRSTAFVSIIANEATNVNNKEQMALYIRWVDEELSVHEYLVELIRLPKTDKNKNLLIRLCLPINHCRGLAHDKASNMSGYLRGVQLIFKMAVISCLCELLSTLH